MKKSIIVQSIITMFLIIAIAGFGVYALIISNSDRKSQVEIDVKDQSINIGINGEASWGDDADKFETQTGPSGIITQIWGLKDLRLTQQSATTPETIKLKMYNYNKDNLYDFTVKIEGVAYDEHSRFKSEVILLCDDTAVESKVITKDQPLFEKTFSGSTENFEFVFKYTLVTLNSSFKVSQDIKITLTTQWSAQ
ncbi:MAG: hypothetical protein IJ959_02795 [Clostridia bacterium]|nr:hypothetical protein [Clostridia bacterium]MBR2220793.1 hypothetical protein [Clostridia bacterium]